MGRATQFIDYINRRIKPTPRDINFHYTSLSISKKIDKIRKNKSKKGDKNG